eukprot:SAG31_NODE_862_length_11416_cov_8.600336_5_plen_79_part_00
MHYAIIGARTASVHSSGLLGLSRWRRGSRSAGRAGGAVAERHLERRVYRIHSYGPYVFDTKFINEAISTGKGFFVGPY